MIKKMTLVRPALFAALLCGVSAASALAQDPSPSPSPGAPGPLTTPPPLLPLPPLAQRHQPGPPPMPLFDALDSNHDGVISAEEIANASASLKSLLKNGSDHLTRDDLRPPAPPLPPGGGPGNPAEDEAGKPRPKIGGIRPHGPPPRTEEDGAANRDEHHGPPPRSDRDQVGDDSARPPRRWAQEMREHRRPFRMEDEEMSDFRPHPQRERLSRHQGPPPHEFDDEMDDDARPYHPEPMRGGPEARPHRAPSPEDAGGPEDRRPEGRGPRGEDAGARPPHQGPPPSPLFDALDANHDGTISADEIASASTALKALLKNGSDHLTRDDLRPNGPPPMGH